VNMVLAVLAKSSCVTCARRHVSCELTGALLPDHGNTIKFDWNFQSASDARFEDEAVRRDGSSNSLRSDWFKLLLI
jgi:hypothetical protein